MKTLHVNPSIIPKDGKIAQQKVDRGETFLHSKIITSRNLCTALIFLLALAAISYVLFTSPRSGAVNNGDFGKYMESVDLTWSSKTPDNMKAVGMVVEEYNYLPFHFNKLTVLNPAQSLIYPVTLIRMGTRLTGIPFSTFSISILYGAVAVLCLGWITRSLFAYYYKWTLAAGISLVFVLFGEQHIAWFNSLYGEASVYIGLLIMIASGVSVAVRSPRKGIWALAVFMFGARFFLGGKPQATIALPVIISMTAIFAFYHRPKKSIQQCIYGAAIVFFIINTCIYSISLYQRNDRYSRSETMWHTMFLGILHLSDNPAKDMIELGIDPMMQADIGKHAYEPIETYAAGGPRGDAFEKTVLDHVNIFTVIKHYLSHSNKLLVMMDYAASQSIEYESFLFRRYGQQFAETPSIKLDESLRLPQWSQLRTIFAGRNFVQYILLYGVILIACLRRICSRKSTERDKLLTVVYVGVLLIGVLQYPLSVIGNGIADVNKQMYTFMLCHDLIVLFSIIECCRALITKLLGSRIRKIRRSHSKHH